MSNYNANSYYAFLLMLSNFYKYWFKEALNHEMFF